MTGGIRRLTNRYTPRANKTHLSRVRGTQATSWPPWSVTSWDRVYLRTALVRPFVARLRLRSDRICEFDS